MPARSILRIGITLVLASIAGLTVGRAESEQPAAAGDAAASRVQIVDADRISASGALLIHQMGLNSAKNSADDLLDPTVVRAAVQPLKLPAHVQEIKRNLGIDIFEGTTFEKPQVVVPISHAENLDENAHSDPAGLASEPKFIERDNAAKLFHYRDLARRLEHIACDLDDAGRHRDAKSIRQVDERLRAEISKLRAENEPRSDLKFDVGPPVPTR